MKRCQACWYVLATADFLIPAAPPDPPRYSRFCGECRPKREPETVPALPATKEPG